VLKSSSKTQFFLISPFLIFFLFLFLFLYRGYTYSNLRVILLVYEILENSKKFLLYLGELAHYITDKSLKAMNLYASGSLFGSWFCQLLQHVIVRVTIRALSRARWKKRRRKEIARSSSAPATISITSTIVAMTPIIHRWVAASSRTWCGSGEAFLVYKGA